MLGMGETPFFILTMIREAAAPPTSPITLSDMSVVNIDCYRHQIAYRSNRCKQIVERFHQGRMRKQPLP
jgi:hypothetical protein